MTTFLYFEDSTICAQEVRILVSLILRCVSRWL
jgi:hypothetical protein